MRGYSDAAVAKMLESEKLIIRAMELRDEAKAMFARANELALEYAKFKETPVPESEEDINW